MPVKATKGHQWSSSLCCFPSVSPFRQVCHPTSIFSGCLLFIHRRNAMGEANTHGLLQDIAGVTSKQSVGKAGGCVKGTD